MKVRWISLTLCLALLAGLLLTGSFSAVAEDPPKEVMIVTLSSGKLLLQICTPDIVRVRYAPGGDFKEKTLDTFTVPQSWGSVTFDKQETAASLVVETAKLKVTVDKSSGQVTFADKSGNVLLTEEGRVISNVPLDGKTYYSIRQDFRASADEYLYGFGNVNDAVGIRGQRVVVEQHNTEKRTPMFYSNVGYGILFDNTCNGELTWANGNNTYRYLARATDSLDYYFMYGPDADAVIGGYRQLTGTATMLPKNAFGYVQSRNRYPNQQALLDTVKKFRDKGIPLDSIVLDYYWWQGNFNNIMQWNSGDWPNPASMMQQLHDNNVSASISIWPSFRAGTPTYQELSQVPGFLMNAAGQADAQFGANYDPSSAANRALYWKTINDSVFSKGLDSIWLDACEPESSRWVRNDSGEDTSFGNSRLIGTLYPLLTNQGVYEGQRAIAGNDKRVNTLSRGAVAGIQRYGIQSWSGDIQAGWASLKSELAGVLNFSAAGLPYFSTDTGGYFGINTSDPDSREMFLRWLQFSTFNSIMRVHGTDVQKEPWQFGAQYESYITDYINLRERLLPYIYALAGDVTQDDYTMVRPLVFDFRTDKNVLTIRDQFMFGPAFMACPVYTPGAREREVYFPAGTWVNFWTGETFTSTGGTRTVAAPLKQIPLFVRAGAVVPMSVDAQYAAQTVDPTEIRVYMGANGSFNWYEDEGDTYNYESGKFSTIPLSWNEAAKTLTIGARQGSFDGMLASRNIRVVFVQPDYGTGVAPSAKYQTTLTYTGAQQTVTFNPDWETPPPALDPETLPKPAPVPQPEHPDKAMVGEWHLDEGEGAKVGDTSGNFNNMSLLPDTNNRWTPDGKAGSAIRFSGGSATSPGTYLEAPHSASQELTDEIAFSGWVNLTGGGHANIINKGGNGNNNPGFSFIVFEGNKLQLEIQTPRNGSTTKKTTAVAVGTFPRNSWHHVAFTWKSKSKGGDGIVRIYIDGVQKSDDGVAANVFEGPIGNDNGSLRIGCSDANEPNAPNYFTGYMDELRLYNYALTAEDIGKLAQMQTIGVANPADVDMKPQSGGFQLTWKDPADAALDKVRVEYRPADAPDAAPTVVNVPKGTQTLTVSGLGNGKYYYVSLFAVQTGGAQSQGVYLIAAASSYATALDALVTHDDMLYGYVCGNSLGDVTGTVTAKVYSGGTLAGTYTLPNVMVSGMDAAQFSLNIGDYADGQTVEVSFAAGIQPLANPQTVTREKSYVPQQDADYYRQLLATELAIARPPEEYTPESYALYTAARAAAEETYNNPDATAAQLLDAVNSVRYVLVKRPAFKRGDVNEDGKVDSTDARMVLQHEVHLLDLEDAALAAADVNRDDRVDSTDARMILQYEV